MLAQRRADRYPFDADAIRNRGGHIRHAFAIAVTDGVTNPIAIELSGRGQDRAFVDLSTGHHGRHLAVAHRIDPDGPR